MWEVDPETKSKLLSLQRLPGNTTCVDCPAASPQWASPKFGIFLCLDCAGIHRGLGVHISFVRSIQMDSFKVGEVRRMEMGGNKAWRGFWEENSRGGRSWEGVSVAERYSGWVGEEYKERLGCKVEGRPFVGKSREEREREAAASRNAAGGSGTGSRSGTPMGRASPARSGSPATMGGSKKEANEAYFAKMGSENSNRRADLAPSQGGKYAGFGSEPSASATAARSAQGGGGGMPGVDEFQADPVKALTKGLGWFSSAVGKGAKSVNEEWIQPTAQKLAEADLATQARLTAAQVAQNVQKGTKGAAAQFNKFVEGEGGAGGNSSGAGGRSVEPEKKDFWDSFGAPSVERTPPAGGKGSSIGTAAMKKGGKDDGWDDKWDNF